MAERSKIEWCDATFNPWIGCQKVSPGCDNCYAEAMMDHRLRRVEWGPHGERKRTSWAYWDKPFQWARRARTEGKRIRVFCASLADWLDNKVPYDWRLDLAQLIEATPELDWLLLTKRPENFEGHAPWSIENVPDNVWLGITAENQETFDRRWPHISSIPARVHFVSYEPALGPLKFADAYPAPDWVICGAESGPNARSLNLDWVRLIRDECALMGAGFFFKQNVVGGRKISLPELDGRVWAEPPRGRSE